MKIRCRISGRVRDLMLVSIGSLLLVTFYVILISRAKDESGSQYVELKVEHLTFKRPHHKIKSEPNLNCSFENYVLGQPINQTDPCLLETFKKKMLLSPRPFSELFNKSSMEKPSDNSDIEKLKWVEKLLIEGSPKGAQFFFVETNAQEGDYSSVTSRLETFGWNGVLIEPRRWTFQTLVKNRKAWAVNTALCLTPNTEIEDLLFEDRIIANTSRSVVQNQTDGQRNKTKVSCIPFYTILKALNGSVVDFLNLNVDGAEFQVLKTIPFDHVIFNVMSVKCIRIPGEKPIGQLMDLLESKQYKLVKTINETNECLFVYKPLYEEKQSFIGSLVKS